MKLLIPSQTSTMQSEWIIDCSPHFIGISLLIYNRKSSSMLVNGASGKRKRVPPREHLLQWTLTIACLTWFEKYAICVLINFMIWLTTAAIANNHIYLVEFIFDFTWCASLTHWGRVTHICVNKLANIVSDNGLSPGRRQANIWTTAGILSIATLGTNFSEILIGIQIFSFKKMHLKMSSAKWRPFVSASMC